MCDIVGFSGGVVVEEVTEGVGVKFGWRKIVATSTPLIRATPPLPPSHALYSYQISLTTNKEKNQDCDKSRAVVFVEVDKELRTFTW